MGKPQALFQNAKKKIERIKVSLNQSTANDSEHFLKDLSRVHDGLDEKNERCLKVMDFIYNYRQDQQAAINQRNEKERMRKETELPVRTSKQESPQSSIDRGVRDSAGQPQLSPLALSSTRGLQLNKQTEDDEEAEFKHKLRHFTDEGNYEKRNNYNNFLRKDNIEAMHKQMLSDQKLAARLMLRGPNAHQVWKPDKFRVPKKGGLAHLNLR